MNQSMTKKERKRQLKADLADLEKKLVTDQAALKAFAERWKAGFRSYTLTNFILAWGQRPNVSILAGFKQWKDRGRYVKKGEHAIWIFAPYLKKVKAEDREDDREEEEKILNGFFPVPVFDVSQTEGEDLDLGANDVQGNGDYSLEDLAGKFPEYPLEYRDGLADGTTDGKTIRVSRRKNKAQQIAAYLHELSHILLQHTEGADRENLPHDKAEVEAESVAYITGLCLGIDSRDSLAYVGGFNGNSNHLRSQASLILKTAERILKRIQK
jgi:hypothetical protein